MANSELYGKTFKVPDDIIKNITLGIHKYPNSGGIKRAKFIIRNGELTYQALKGIKNFFDNYNPETTPKEQYELAGGDLMKNFIETTLSSNRGAVERSKEVRRDSNVDFNLGTKPQKMPRLHEGVDIENKNAIIIVVNMENEILLLRRKPDAKWGANKWAFVGGSLQRGESPEEACKRECKEETGIDVEEVINVFNIQRGNLKNTEYVFACRYYDDGDVVLNGEHTKYGWFTLNQIKTLKDKSPNLDEYLRLAFKKYE